MSKSHHGGRSTFDHVERQAVVKMLPFFAPYVLPGVVLGLGTLFHHLWGNGPVGQAIAPTLIVLASLVLGWLAWKYAAPRQDIQRAHVTASVFVVGSWFYVLQVFGFKTSSVEYVLVMGLCLAISWTIRRLGVVIGEGKDEHGAGKEEPDWHGLKRPRKWKAVEETPDRTVIEATLSPGQGVKEALSAAPHIGSEVGAVRGGVRVIPGEREGDAQIQIYWEDLGKRTYPWNGPTYVGESISYPVSLGRNESGELVLLYLMGNDVENVAKGNVKFGGVTRSGKGVAIMILMCETRGRKDVFPMISDHSKGEQLLGLFRGGLTRENSWVANSDKKLLRQAKAVQKSIRERNLALGKFGYSSWEPAAFEDERLKMPAIAWFIEEFGSSILIRNPQLIINIANECLSAGIVVVISMQRLAYDQIPTSLRAAFSQGVCFGVESDTDAEFVLDPETLSTGVSPGGWGVRYPGRFMCSLNGVPDSVNVTPARTFFGMSKQEFEGMVRAFMDSVGNSGPRLDPVTRAAFGPEYEAWVSGTGDWADEPIRISGTSDQTGDDIPQSGIRKPGGAASFNPEIQEDETEGAEDMEFDPELDDPNSENYLEKIVNPDQDLFDKVDPRLPIMPSGLPEMDMTEPDTPGTIRRVLSKEEKATLWNSILEAHEGEDIDTATLIFEWRNTLGLPEANRDPGVSALIGESCDSGELERLGRGRFRVPTSSVVAR